MDDGSMIIGIGNEWGPLKKVMVGHGRDMGPAPTAADSYDPTSKKHLLEGTYPKAQDVEAQLDHLADLLSHEGVEVMRPADMAELEQVFARDVGMVIDDVFIRSRMIADRQAEWEGIAPLLKNTQVSILPDEAELEGGDVVVMDNLIAVGVTRRSELLDLQTSRTNQAGLDFLARTFPNREVWGAELHKDDDDPLRCALHLDCAFMPLGLGQAIVCPDAFLDRDQLHTLTDRFDEVINISLQEAALLQSNLLHVAPEVILIDPRFDRLSAILREKGYRLIQCPMNHVGKMGGLFRCATLPLLRSH